MQWQKNNPRATFKDLADVFDKAGRQDLVDLTLKVANGRVYVPRLSSKPKLSCPRTSEYSSIRSKEIHTLQAGCVVLYCLIL